MAEPMTFLELHDAIAKAIADAIGHGMREKCERHADAVLAVVGPQLLAASEPPAQAAQVDDKSQWPEWATKAISDAFHEGCRQTRELMTAEPVAQPADTVGVMDEGRAIYFLRRFKQEEKLLGPHEQWALDFAIAKLSTQPHSPDAADSGRVVAERAAYERWFDGEQGKPYDGCWVFGRAAWLARAALAAQGQGKAVAEVVERGPDEGYLIGKYIKLHSDLPHGTKLYAAPPSSPAGVPDGVRKALSVLATVANRVPAPFITAAINTVDAWLAAAPSAAGEE